MAYTTEVNVEALLGESFDDTTTPTSTEIIQFIAWADALIDKKSGTKFESTTATDEIYDWNMYTTEMSIDANYTYPVVTRNHSLSFLLNDTLILRNAPIISVTSLYRNTSSPANGETWEALTEGTGNDFLISNLNEGKIQFIQNTPYVNFRSVKITYEYGSSTVPSEVERLSSLLVAREIVQSRVANAAYDSSENISVGIISISKSLGESIGLLKYYDKRIEEAWRAIDSFNTVLI